MTHQQKPDGTRVDSILRGLKNRPAIAILVVLAVIVIGAGTVTDSITKIWDFVVRAHRSASGPIAAAPAPRTLPAAAHVGDVIEVATKLIREQHAYETARRKLEPLDNGGNPEDVRTAVRGLIIATYYGMQTDRQGLDYICRLYLTRPRDDVRFRFEIQAFLRRIALREGFAAAEDLVTTLRARCNRLDLSYVWAGIPLAKAEYLSQGKATFEEFYSLSREDATYLRYVVERYPDDAFRDHALYFLGRFEEVVTDYPESTILDVVYRSLASKAFEDGDTDKGIAYLRTALGRWPGSTRIADDLSEAYLKAGLFKDYWELRKRFTLSGDGALIGLIGGPATISGPQELRAALKRLALRTKGLGGVRDLFQRDCTRAFRLASYRIEDEKYAAALESYRTAIAVLGEYNIKVPSCVSAGERILERIVGVQANGEVPQREGLTGADARRGGGPETLGRALQVTALGRWPESTAGPEGGRGRKRPPRASPR